MVVLYHDPVRIFFYWSLSIVSKQINVALWSPEVAYFPGKNRERTDKSFSGILLLLRAGREFSCICSSLHLLFLDLEGRHNEVDPFHLPQSILRSIPKLFLGPLNKLGASKKG